MLLIQSDINSQLEPIKLNVNYPLFFKDLFSGHSAGDFFLKKDDLAF